MKKGVYGKKLGMTQIFTEAGLVVPVTVIEVEPCVVIKKKTVETDGYTALQVATGEVKEKQMNKPMKGQFDKANIAYKKYIKELRLDNIDEYNVGDEIKADVFAAGDFVDVQGISKGKGFQGVIKRHGQSRGPMGHGSMYHRRPGSMGSTSTPGRVFKGKKLPGHMGVETVTIQNLRVVAVDLDKNVILVKGSVPGAKGSILKIRNSIKAIN
jgi:large subunit ribosomal protein L3